MGNRKQDHPVQDGNEPRSKVNRRRFFKQSGLAAGVAAAVTILGGTAHAAQPGTLNPSSAAGVERGLAPMSFQLGNGSMNSGETQNWWYELNNNSDFGAQFAMGNPLGFNSQLISFNFGKNRNSGGVTYFVSITNNGPNPTTFNLQGGGLT